ncbi:sigma 54-interacting transcriptional regulator [Bacillus sp. FJAT-47783]|uniref:sigma-54 interaction domain-containing protein n=1 Tax=Bacillus sp. FJAT-47783 TaxID=2922712 RepID=UPI001FABBE5E|nr:sigma 54-interacting transcriptional regulator [Bacillus sp. FJAT-47783]
MKIYKSVNKSLHFYKYVNKIVKVMTVLNDNISLKALSYPWNDSLQMDEMIVVPRQTTLADLDQLVDGKDFALIDENNMIVGWVPYERLADALFHHWKMLSSFYETLLKAVDDAITIVDANGTIISWNPKAEELYECSRENSIGKHITKLFKEESVVLMSTLKEGKTVVRKYNQPQSDVHVLINTQPVYLKDEMVGGISVERNISDIVKLNEELSSTTAYIQHLESQMDTEDDQLDPFRKIKGRSPALMSAIQLAKKVAMTDASVLITGESGVGKELFSQAIHQASERKEAPFIAINCGAIPAALFESELFGYEKGAFTGAVKEGKKGKIDAAKGGTLFLDEIGEMPLDLQVKLLRVLQEKQFYRIGGTKPIPVDVRIIAATNRDLEKMVSEGTFRQDLYYRLNVVSIHIPPLRERMEDIPELVQLYLNEFSIKYKKPIPTIDPEVMYRFMEDPWKGNIRQLRNTIERIMILADEETITPSHLPQSFQQQANKEVQPPKKEEQFMVSHPSEKEKIQYVLQKTYGNKSAAAKLLGVSRVTLYNKMKKYGITE